SHVRPVGANLYALALPDALPISAFIQKRSRQSPSARITAPYRGPSTLPSSWTAPTTPSGSPRRSGGQASATSARVGGIRPPPPIESEEHTSELQSRFDLVCRLLL